MLRELRIENIAVIERADIVFDTGLNVMTGETGAGKSIVIDSIAAVTGSRISRELIRKVILKDREALPMGEFAIGTNTAACAAARKYGIDFAPFKVPCAGRAPASRRNRSRTT